MHAKTMRVRVRQHVNPLASKYQQPVELPDWSEIYEDLNRPFLLDLGSARGRFLLHMARERPAWNYLGVEIRQPLVEEANARRDAENLRNLHYLFANVQVSLEDILRSLPPGAVQMVTVLFPDPWFKKRHHKRRMIQPPVVDTLARYLPEGAEVFLASDVLEAAEHMTQQFDAHEAFVRTHEGWLPENPLPVASEREVASLKKGRPIYRALYRKNTRKP